MEMFVDRVQADDEDQDPGSILQHEVERDPLNVGVFVGETVVGLGREVALIPACG